MDINSQYKLLAVQNHKNNQFNTKGENVSVLNTFRSRYGYPHEGEVRSYLAVSDRQTPVIIIQKYDQPIENRPADEVYVYELPKNVYNEINPHLLCQFTSDLLFETNCANLEGNNNIVVGTWIRFINIARYNRKINLNECIYELSSKSSEKINEACYLLSEEIIERAFYMMNSLRNSTNDRIKAIEIASLDFDSQVNFDSSEIIEALKCLPECEFKLKGFLYLSQVDNSEYVAEYIRNNQCIQKNVFYKYINMIEQRDTEAAQRCRLYLNPSSLFDLEVSKETIDSIIQDNTVTSYDLMIEILTLSLVFYSYKICYDFVDVFRIKVKSDQTFRHELMIYIHNSKEKNKMLLYFLNYINLSDLISLFSMDYRNKYAHDAYFLGFIKENHYKRICKELKLNNSELYEIIIKSNVNEDGYLNNFIRTATRKIRKKVILELKLYMVSSVNSEIRECLRNLTSLYRKKLGIQRNIRKIWK